MTFATRLDAWAVSTREIPLEPGPDGWHVTRTPLPVRNIRLAQADDRRRYPKRR
jgi:hypothetical protein